MTDIKVTYMDHEIEYRESSNDWTSNGRTFYSLAGAKKAVDKLLSEARKLNAEAIFIGDVATGMMNFTPSRPARDSSREPNPASAESPRSGRLIWAVTGVTAISPASRSASGVFMRFIINAQPGCRP